MAGALLPALLVLSISQASAQDHSAHSSHNRQETMPMAMAMNEQTDMDLQDRTQLLESEFNHHLAGFFVILAGLFILAEGVLSQRWALFRLA
jgi:hypothetical protein